MLTAIELENFKGFAARQRIELAPITLLFGANSAGKSTVLQSLLYIHELIERGDADVDRTELGGQTIELGGFARLVHGHDTTRRITLRVEFDTPGMLERLGRDTTDFPFPDLEDQVESAWLELSVRFRTEPTFRGPLVERAVFGVNGDVEPLVWLEMSTTVREGEPLRARINLGHPLLATEKREHPDVIVMDADGKRGPLTSMHAPTVTTEAWEQIAIPEDDPRRRTIVSGSARGAKARSKSRSRTGAKERASAGHAARTDVVDGSGSGAGGGLGDGSGFGDGRSLPVFAVSRSRASALPHPAEPLRVRSFGDDSPESAETAEQVRTFLEMIVQGTTTQLAALLRTALYIGPLRTIPPRGALFARSTRVASWADGLAAWDTLLADRGGLVDETNYWLERIGTQCQVVLQQLVEPQSSAERQSEDHVDDTIRRLLLRTAGQPLARSALVLPSEVGAGISQIMPVIVAALSRRTTGIVAVEQPELHVHPAVQTGLGDLMIDTSRSRAFLVETHSEHLMLRLLRRIRQTTEGTLGDEDSALTPEKLSVIYVEPTPEGIVVTRLRVDERGEFADRWPRGFFGERMKELL